jgi:hypothetical protein
MPKYSGIGELFALRPKDIRRDDATGPVPRDDLPAGDCKISGSKKVESGLIFFAGWCGRVRRKERMIVGIRIHAKPDWKASLCIRERSHVVIALDEVELHMRSPTGRHTRTQVGGLIVIALDEFNLHTRSPTGRHTRTQPGRRS